MLRIPLSAFLALFALSACFPRGAGKLVTGTDFSRQRPFVKPETLDRVSWELVSKTVFEKRCTSCHGKDGGVNLESYEEARRHEAAIDHAVFTRKTMPPKGKPLTAEQREVLAAWISAGMPFEARKPENAPAPVPPPPTPGPLPEPPPVPSPNPNPSPNPSPAPPSGLEPTYASIMKLVIQPKCIECHNPDGEVDYMPMNTLEDLFAEEYRIVVPGDPEQSRFIRSVLPSAKKIMPPKKTGLAPLTPAEIEIISNWIRAGAKD